MTQPGTSRAKSGIVQHKVVIAHAPGNPPTVSPDPVCVSKAKNEEVVWTCPQGAEFTVIMANGTSPFEKKVFTKTNNESGMPIVAPDPGKHVYFKYLVQVGEDIADPGVVIDP